MKSAVPRPLAQVEHGRVVDRLDDAGVDDHQVGARLPGKDAHCSVAAGEGGEHPARDLLWIGADAPARDAVVARNDDDDRVERIEAAARSGDADGEVLEAAEAAARLRLLVEAPAQRRDIRRPRGLHLTHR